MKKVTLLIVCLIALFCESKAQLPMGSLGTYYFVANYDQNGEEIDVRGFNEITVQVVTTNFFGIVQSSAFYSYFFNGMSQQSGSFEYRGVSNGWFIYTFYNQQLLISTDREQVMTTNPYGGLALYSK